MRKHALYERARVGEYWPVHPTDHIVTIYHLTAGSYGKPGVAELTAETAARAVAVTIDWERVTRQLPPIE